MVAYSRTHRGRVMWQESFFCLCWPSIFQIKYLAKKAIYKKLQITLFLENLKRNNFCLKHFFLRAMVFNLFVKILKKIKKIALFSNIFYIYSPTTRWGENFLKPKLFIFQFSLKMVLFVFKNKLKLSFEI